MKQHKHKDEEQNIVPWEHQTRSWYPMGPSTSRNFYASGNPLLRIIKVGFATWPSLEFYFPCQKEVLLTKALQFTCSWSVKLLWSWRQPKVLIVGGIDLNVFLSISLSFGKRCHGMVSMFGVMHPNLKKMTIMFFFKMAQPSDFIRQWWANTASQKYKDGCTRPLWTPEHLWQNPSNQPMAPNQSPKGGISAPVNTLVKNLIGTGSVATLNTIVPSTKMLFIVLSPPPFTPPCGMLPML